MKKIALFFIVGLLLWSCSKSEKPDNFLPGEEYMVEIDNLSTAEGSFIATSSMESKKITLKAAVQSKISLHANVGEYVQFSVLLPAGGGVRVLDKKGVVIVDYISFQKPLSEYQDLHFIAFDPENPNKDPFAFKTGMAQKAVNVLFRKTFVMDKRYSVENGVLINSPLMPPCVADDQFEFTEYPVSWLNMIPDILVTAVSVKHGASKCEYWPSDISLPPGNLTYFKNEETAIMMPVYDPANPEYLYYGLVKLQLDSISTVNQTLTLHKDISATKKEVFVYRRIN